MNDNTPNWVVASWAVFAFLLALTVTVFLAQDDKVQEVDGIAVGAPTPAYEFTNQQLRWIEAHQANILSKYLNYIQLTEDGRAILNRQTSSTIDLSSQLPQDAYIDTYEADGQKGFILKEVRYVTAGTSTVKQTKATAYGPKSTDFTHDWR